MSTPTTSRHADYFASRPIPRARPSGSFAATAGQFGSPAALSREPEELVIYELHPRSLSAGFAGESRPRCVHRFGYHLGDGRRAGDFREFSQKPDKKSPRNKDDERWGEPYELYGANVRDLDLALMSDRLERAVRQIHTEHLQLVSSRTLKAALIVPSLTPTPILEVVLRVLFQHYAQPPTITLLTTPVLSCLSAGLRSALVVEIGWEETPYREGRKATGERDDKSVANGKRWRKHRSRIHRERHATDGLVQAT